MKLGDICQAPCFNHAPDFEIPPPGCTSQHLRFGQDDEREFYAVLLNNHAPNVTRTLNPKLAIVGLSPAGNQIAEFVEQYAITRDYGKASVAGAFAGLSKAIIAMFKGLGLAEKLQLNFPDPESLAYHPDIHVTSLVACATLSTNQRSDDFDPCESAAATRCITQRFVREMTNPEFKRLSHIIILGSKAWIALQKLQMRGGQSVLAYLRASGKTLLNLPHPSGQNSEYVKLASLSHDQVPSLQSYVTTKWGEYQLKPARQGRNKQPIAEYKAKRAAVWESVQTIRNEIANIPFSADP